MPAVKTCGFWNESLILPHDIYFTKEYVSCFEKLTGPMSGKGILFTYSDETCQGFIPIIINKIPGTDYFDFTSPYGYSGPLIKGNKEKFWKEFKKYCQKNKIVCGFIRYNPLLQNHDEKCTARNETVWIDLTKTKEKLFQEMNKKCRNQIKKSEKSGVTIHKAVKEDIENFHEIYISTMKRAHSKQEYHFPKSFFIDTIEKTNSFLLIAKSDKKIIAGAIFLIHPPFAHYHFSATTEQGRKLYATNLLISKAIEICAKESKKMHLGGGTDSNPKNNLLRFKSGFSPKRSRFYTQNFIAIKDIFQKLSKNYKTDYFPPYRK